MVKTPQPSDQSCLIVLTGLANIIRLHPILNIVSIMTTTYLVTGANRRIGRAFVNHLASWPNSKVVGAVRDLSRVQDQENVSFINLNYFDSLNKIEKNLTTLNKIAPNGVDVVISNVGIKNRLLLADSEKAQHKAHVEVKVVGAIKFSRAVMPYLSKSKGDKKLVLISTATKFTNRILNSPFPAFWHPQKALNKAVSEIAIETKGKAVVVAVHPGPVESETSRGSYKLSGKLAAIVAAMPKVTPEESVQKMTSVIEKLTIDDTGSFVTHEGEKVEW